jgi:hypothetical protein
LVFVLYAGPVASLFPAYQERVIQQTAVGYDQIRVTRKTLYNVVKENPELEAFAKVVIILKQQTDIEKFLLSQPSYLRSLASRPEEVGLMRTLGVPLPELEPLVSQLADEPPANEPV